MPGAGGTVEWLAAAFGAGLGTFAYKLGDEAVLDTLARLGVAFPAGLLTDAVITPARRTAIDAANALSASVETLRAALAGDAPAAAVTAGAAVLRDAAGVLGAVGALADVLGTRGPALPGVQPAQVGALVAGFARKLLDLAAVDAMDDLSASLGAALTLAGIVQRVPLEGDPADPARPDFEEVTVHYDRLPAFACDPAGLLRSLYDWDDPAFDGLRLLTALRDGLALVGFPVLLAPPSAGDPAQLRSSHFVVSPDGPGLRIALGTAVGLDDAEAPVPVPGAGWSASVAARWDLPAGTAVEIAPPLTVTARPPAGTADGEVRWTVTGAPPAPIVLLGQAGGSRLEAAAITLTGGLTIAWRPDTGQGEGNLALDGEIRGGKLVIDASGGDGFVAALLSGVRLETGFGVGFTFAPDDGLRFHGSGGLQIQIPVHVDLGPVAVQAVYLRASISDGTVPVELSAGFAANLGPVKASVDRLGLLATLSFPAGGGNLGPADLTFGFKSPTGAGLAVGAGVVTGGGFLGFDPDAGEYAGVLELELLGFLAVKAIGLITTRMPDGSKGFSLLLVLSAEFPAGGLQLGYGFTLLAVGGLIGLHRGMRLDAIVEGVRTGAIESVMFPRDVVANAPRILSDLKAFFPPQQGIFLIGPMAKLGWGTPTLVSVSLGVIIEIPGNVAILGVLKVALPTEAEAIVLLQVNFAGAIEFDKKRLYFFASLYDSRILTITITGELGLLVAWGDQPDFVLSVGGFHPAFKPPPLPFPVPRRISVDILNNGVERISVDGYFAVTSNTAQFGAHAELSFGFSALSVQGHVSFDALFQFSPFRFVIDISAGVSVKAFDVGLFSVSLELTLSGPAPWEAKGSASISLLFFSIPVDFDVTWGQGRDTLAPPVKVLPLLAAELAKPESWRTRAPAGGGPLVNLRPLAAGEADIVLHPLGTLIVQQRAVPLDVRVDKVGSEHAADVSQCQVSVNGAGLVKVSDATDMFALAQYEDLSDAQKLSLPSFEPEHAGLELAPDGAAMTSRRAVRRSARYEQIVIAPDLPAPSVSHFVPYNSTLFEHFLGGASVARSPLAQAQRTLRQPFTDRVAVLAESYVVASRRDNTAAGPVFGSQAQARAHLGSLLAADPARVDQLHVIPATEVAT